MLISTKLLNLIHKTRFPILGFISCLKFWACLPNLFVRKIFDLSCLRFNPRMECIIILNLFKLCSYNGTWCLPHLRFLHYHSKIPPPYSKISPHHHSKIPLPVCLTGGKVPPVQMFV